MIPDKPVELKNCTGTDWLTTKVRHSITGSGGFITEAHMEVAGTDTAEGGTVEDDS